MRTTTSRKAMSKITKDSDGEAQEADAGSQESRFGLKDNTYADRNNGEDQSAMKAVKDADKNDDGSKGTDEDDEMRVETGGTTIRGKKVTRRERTRGRDEVRETEK